MSIYVNQIGYLPKTAKVAISTSPCNYQVIRVSDQKAVLDGSVSEGIMDDVSGDTAYQIDFSSIAECGEYYILLGNGEKSYTFSIGNDIFHKLQYDLSKCLYYQRCGMELLPEHAGIYTHKVCHTAPAIMLSDYQKKTENPKEYDMRGGWHDAGDFGRYVSAGAVAVGHVLYAYELFPESFKNSLNIPESGNGIPDILNECLYELKWLMKMQAPDGGAYHKLTAFRHAEFIMPEEDHDRFIIYPVSSFSTGDFAAVMALASRVYRPFLPEFADEALSKAKKAYEWLTKNSYVGFKNPEGCNTGEYGDADDTDERLWAAAEMLRVDAANNDKYLKDLKELVADEVSKTDFGWTDVSGFASMSILTDPGKASGSMYTTIKSIVLTECGRLSTILRASGYRLGMINKDFVWGSNMVVANRGMLFILGSLITDEALKEKYIACAMDHLSYLLGRNALGISYITGEGTNAFKNPHNRVTACDGIDEPMPGWVSGGPFRTPVDAAATAAIPKGTAPMKCYLDDVGSYSTNEITIYWNSPVIFITAFVNSL